MAKYEDMAEEGKKPPQRFEDVSEGLGTWKKRYPGQTKPLPGDEPDMEFNKDRQDYEMKKALANIAKGVIGGPAGIAGEAAAEAIKRARGMKKGGKVSSASKRADGCAQRGKTRGRII